MITGISRVFGFPRMKSTDLVSVEAGHHPVQQDEVGHRLPRGQALDDARPVHELLEVVAHAHRDLGELRCVRLSSTIQMSEGGLNSLQATTSGNADGCDGRSGLMSQVAHSFCA